MRRFEHCDYDGPKTKKATPQYDINKPIKMP